DLYRAAEDVRQHVDPSGYILATHEILYLAQRTGDLSYYGHVCPTCTADTFLEQLRARRIDAMVWTEKDDYRAPQVVQDPVVVSVLEQCYTSKTHGVFLVYLYAPDLDCPLDNAK